MDEKYICSECGSPNICKLSIIHRNGLSSSEGSASQYRDFMGANDVRVTVRSQSAMSRAVEPPGHPLLLIVLLVVAEVTIFFLFGLYAIVLGYYFKNSIPELISYISMLVYLLIAAYIVFVAVRSIITYPADKAKWNNSYHCQRCDVIFQLNLQ